MKPYSEIPPLDIAGIGIGPSNLSFSALMEPVKSLRWACFEKQPEFKWHPGLMFSESTVTVNFIKDLVSLVDPTNRHSFLNFLRSYKRLYRFLIADFPNVLRAEYEQYLRWVSNSLADHLHFGHAVELVEHVEGYFKLTMAGRVVRAKNIVVGCGAKPEIPGPLVPHVGPNVCHSSQYLLQRPAVAGKRVAVIGGGQSGGEIVLHLLLAPPEELPSVIYWITRRPGFQALNNSCFANEFFTPSYADYFYQLPSETRSRLNQEQILASDGITDRVLQSIYRALYRHECVGGQRRCEMFPSHELIEVTRASDSTLRIATRHEAGSVRELSADTIIACTGYKAVLPDYMEPLLPSVKRDGHHLVTRPDYALAWTGPEDRRIFVQGLARHQRGVGDPNLGLMPWRNATIINSLAGRAVYDVESESTAMGWENEELSRAYAAPAHAAAHELVSSRGGR
jgi:lysine N6-hydroxylase